MGLSKCLDKGVHDSLPGIQVIFCQTGVPLRGQTHVPARVAVIKLLCHEAFVFALEFQHRLQLRHPQLGELGEQSDAEKEPAQFPPRHEGI